MTKIRTIARIDIPKNKKDLQSKVSLIKKAFGSHCSDLSDIEIGLAGDDFIEMKNTIVISGHFFNHKQMEYMKAIVRGYAEDLNKSALARKRAGNKLLKLLNS